jgi:hypothetical protein
MAQLTASARRTLRFHQLRRRRRRPSPRNARGLTLFMTALVLLAGLVYLF